MLSLLASLVVCQGPPVAAPIVLLRSSELDASVGKLVTLQGTVENSRAATLRGVDVASESPDLRGQPATATGILRREHVTQEQLDRQKVALGGEFAHRGPGTYYSLVDPRTGRLAQVQSVASPMMRVPAGRFVARELTLELLPDWRLRFTGHPSLVVEGPYAVTATKLGGYHLSCAIERVQGTPARVLDTPVRVGDLLRATLELECVDGRRAVSACLHDAGADGKQVVCGTFADPASKCTAGPPIDGSKINLPARP